MPDEQSGQPEQPRDHDDAPRLPDARADESAEVSHVSDDAVEHNDALFASTSVSDSAYSGERAAVNETQPDVDAEHMPQQQAVPVVADNQLHPVDPRVVPADRLAGLISLAILSGPSAIALVLATFFTWPSATWLVVLWSGWLVITLYLIWITVPYPRLSFRYTRYRVNDFGIEIRTGVLWRSITNVPRSRIQHTDVGQGPIQRMFGISTLTVYTAGTAESSVNLPGLEYQTALVIRNDLIGSDEGDDAA